MKRIYLVVVLLGLAVVSVIGEEEAKEPVKEPLKLVQLRQQYQKDLAAVVTPLKQKYLKSLQDLQVEVTKAGKLEDALAVKAEVTALEEDLKSDKPVKFKYNPIGKWMWNGGLVEITATEVITNQGSHFKWQRVNDKTFKVYWGSFGEHVCTFNPDGKSFKILRTMDGASQFGATKVQ